MVSVETSSTPRRAWLGCGGTGNGEPCLEPRAPGHGVCCRRRTRGASLVVPWAPSSSTLPLPCTMSPTDRSGVREASGSVTAEYTVGTSSTTSTAYAIDNTATKKWGGDMPRTDPPAPGWRLGQLPAVLPCAGRASCQTRAGSRQQGTDGEDQVLGQGRLKEKRG